MQNLPNQITMGWHDSCVIDSSNDHLQCFGSYHCNGNGSTSCLRYPPTTVQQENLDRAIKEISYVDDNVCAIED